MPSMTMHMLITVATVITILIVRDSQAGDFNRQFNGIRDNANSTCLVSCPIIADEVSITAGTTQVRVHYSGTGQPAVLFVA